MGSCARLFLNAVAEIQDQSIRGRKGTQMVAHEKVTSRPKTGSGTAQIESVRDRETIEQQTLVALG